MFVLFYIVYLLELGYGGFSRELVALADFDKVNGAKLFMNVSKPPPAAFKQKTTSNCLETVEAFEQQDTSLM